MSEKLLRFLLSEIKTIRITCQNCKTVVEVPLDKVGTKFSDGQCRFCKTALFDSGIDLFASLSRSINMLNAVEKQVQVEIVFPDKF